MGTPWPDSLSTSRAAARVVLHCRCRRRHESIGATKRGRTVKSAPVQGLLSKLQNVKPSGQGYSARCPAHPDTRSSLSVSQGDDGRALVCCHAGCTADAICSAIGWALANLMPAKNGKPKPRENNSKPHREAFATSPDAIAALDHKRG